jgi:hypothetical protein
MKFNVIIAKRDRTEYLNTCLHYLNLANQDGKHSVFVYITSDSDKELALPEQYNHIPIESYYFPVEGFFNKSKLLNNSLEKMRSDFDAVTIIDLDMVYCPNFFNNLESKLTRTDYIVSCGFKLQPDGSEVIKKRLPSFNDIKSFPKEEFLVGPSQITMRKRCYELFTKRWGKLYNEAYCQWGHDDSEVSTKSRYLHRYRMISKSILTQQWYHLYHDSCNVGHPQYNQNNLVFNEVNIRLAEEFSHINTIPNRVTI